MKVKVSLGYLVLGFVLGCAQNGEKRTELPVERLSFRLADGSYLSSPLYHERSPQLVQHPSGYLSLVFVSDRPCNNEANYCPERYYRIFLARSLAPYTGRNLPAFSTPLTVKNANNFPIAQKDSPFIIAAHAASENVVIYSKASALLQRDEVSPQAVSIESLYSQSGNFELLGIHEYDGNKLYLRLQDKLYYRPFDTNLGVGNLGSSIPYYFNRAQEINGNITGVPLDLYPNQVPFFNSIGRGLLLGLNSSRNGLAHFSFYLGILRSLMDLWEIDVVKTNEARQELLIFSGQSYRNGDNTVDIYAVSSHRVRDLWRIGFSEWEGFHISDIFYRAFITENSYPANLSPVSNADFYCSGDPMHPGNGTFKAFIFGGNTFGRPAEEFSQILKPNTIYYQKDGQNPFFRTNENAKIDYIYQSHPSQFWTGLNSDYTEGLNCIDAGTNPWSDTSASNQGRTWNFATQGPISNPNHFTSIDDFNCYMTTKHLLCVEQ